MIGTVPTPGTAHRPHPVDRLIGPMYGATALVLTLAFLLSFGVSANRPAGGVSTQPAPGPIVAPVAAPAP